MISVAADGDNAIVVSPGANAHLSPGDVANATAAISYARVVLLQLEVPVDAVAEAAQLSEGTVVLNPAPAPGKPLPAALLENVDILVPNQTELAALAGHRGDVDLQTAAGLAERLPVPSSVITLGAEGALVVAGGETTHIPAPEITAIDTTAAGDAFCGALADALVGGADLVEASRWAVRVGAATTLRAGAQPSLPNPEQVAALLDGR